jgi:hypothetical protein
MHSQGRALSSELYESRTKTLVILETGFLRQASSWSKIADDIVYSSLSVSSEEQLLTHKRMMIPKPLAGRSNVDSIFDLGVLDVEVESKGDYTAFVESVVELNNERRQQFFGGRRLSIRRVSFVTLVTLSGGAESSLTSSSSSKVKSKNVVSAGHGFSFARYLTIGVLLTNTTLSSSL